MKSYVNKFLKVEGLLLLKDFVQLKVCIIYHYRVCIIMFIYIYMYSSFQESECFYFFTANISPTIPRDTERQGDSDHGR